MFYLFYLFKINKSYLKDIFFFEKEINCFRNAYFKFKQTNDYHFISASVKTSYVTK